MRNINFEITGKSYDTTVKVEYDHADIDVEKLFESFFTVARGLGWQDETIREHIMELAAQYKDDTTDDIQKYDDGFDGDDDEVFPGWGHHPFRSGEPTGSHSAESATIPE